MKKPPTTVRISGRVVPLIAEDPEQMPEAYGAWHSDEGIIKYRTGMTLLETQDTLLHEVFHSLRSYQGREYGGIVEEDYVRSFATGLIGVLQDNPEFAKWLTCKPTK